jgi:CDP-diacylglycerol--glycerol-3-phosphate 3-phosphatidyltransferase
VPAPGKPWVTANQVTLLRLIPMPLLSWLIYKGGENGGANPYRGSPYMWSALIAGIILGCTDWVDGMLARKYGPTVLGGLLDPIADKVFVAFAYMPFASLGLVPAWACALMFVREFFVTALRSAYEQRDLTLKTSYLAKAKTWTQMQGIGVMLLFPLVDNPRVIMPILIAGTALPIVAMLGLYLVKKKLWRGAIWMSASVGATLGLYAYDSDWALSVRMIMIGVVGITWLSGFDYVMVGWKQLRGRGDFSRADLVRIVGSISVPCLVFAVLVDTPPVPLKTCALFAVLSLELSVGGLDNLLSHHKHATKALAWGGRALGASVLLLAALLLPDFTAYFSLAAALCSLVGVSAEFWRGRDYFMDKRIRDKALRDAAAAPAS